MYKFQKILTPFFLMVLSTIASSKNLEIVTTDFYPFQEQTKKGVEGLATEIVQAIIKTSGHTSTITLYPWARAYQMALTTPNVLIYSIARTPEREKKFKWIGTLVPYNIYLWKLSARSDIVINTIEDAKKFSVGGVVEDIKAKKLQQLGFIPGKNLIMVAREELNIRKLYSGHLDLISFDDFTLPYKLKQSGYDFTKLTRLVKLDQQKVELYLAANLETSDEVVKDLKHAMKIFKKSQRYKEISRPFRIHR